MSAAATPGSDRRVGLLGGTFDPPHLGHLVAAECARIGWDLDEVRLLVASDPWMKSTSATAADRVEMARLAVGDDPYLTVDARELHRRGPTYTADTLAELHTEDPGVHWVFVVGADAAASLDDWERIAEVESLAELVCVDRPGYARVERPGLGHLEVPGIDVSSTALRRRVARGEAVRYLTPPAVADHIAARGLYATV